MILDLNPIAYNLALNTQPSSDMVFRVYVTDIDRHVMTMKYNVTAEI